MAAQPERKIYEFEEFRLDAANLILYRNTQEITLPPKAVRTLLALIEKHGEIVHKNELMDIIWTDSIVEESNLSQYLHILRKTFGKKSNGKPFIETLRRRGYRFTADIKRVEKKVSENPLSNKVKSDDRSPISKPTNAFQAHQQARIFYHQHTFPALVKSRAFLEEALRFDVNYAPAYAALAELCLMEGIFGIYELSKSFANAKDALKRAFELDADSAETYAAAGLVELICDWNFPQAKQNLQKSLKLNPHCAIANNYLGQVYLFQCQFDEAITYLKRSVKIKPTGLFNRSVLLTAYFVGRQYKKAIEESEKILALNPEWLVVSTMRCWVLEQTGRVAEAIAVYEKLSKEPGGEFIRRWSGYAYAKVGDEKNARKTAALVLAESREHFVSPTHLAALYAALNDSDKACYYLENALALQDPWLLYIACDPRFDNLRANSRFQKLENKVLSKSVRTKLVNSNSK
jgi:DNA-binding winged helix-turn-helix (wHTH) protein/Tfp pilus assembly protein PilF